MKADSVDEETLGTRRQRCHNAKQRKKLVKGYLAQMANEAQTEKNNEKKKDNIQIFPYRYIYIKFTTYITITNILRTSKFNATRKHMNLLMLYR